jgi:threonine aldolase
MVPESECLSSKKNRIQNCTGLFDTISVCFSKGLGAQFCVSNKATIARALRVRKILGGGMRQVGYLAAAGIYALDHNIERLEEDHRSERAC